MPDTSMTKDAIQAAVRIMASTSVDFMDNIAVPRIKRHYKYYHGGTDLKTRKGRSNVVMTETRDTIEALMPTLMRIFLTTKNPVEFEPETADDVEMADQATELVNHVVMKENDGWMLLSDFMRDALIADYSAIKVWWDKSPQVEEIEYSGLGEEDLAVLTNDPDIKILEALGTGDPEPGVEAIYDVKVRKTTTEGRCRLTLIPSEELIIDRNATDYDTAKIIGHRAYSTVSEGIAQGYPPDACLRNSGIDKEDPNRLYRERSTFVQEFETHPVEAEDGHRMLIISELYVRLDQDGDGVSELRRIVALGTQYEIVENDAASEIPIAIASPFMIPNAILGFGIGRITVDLQDISTAVTRNTLDSLYSAVNPRYAIVAGQVNEDDVLDERFKGLIRMRAPGMVQPLETNYLGAQTLAFLEWLDQKKEQRTGISKVAAGLDADVLQSTTALAVNAMMTAAQAKSESIARTLAELGLCKVFCLVLKCLIRHQDKNKTIKLTGKKFASYDVAEWNPGLRVTCRVGLGRGTTDERMHSLQVIAAEQKTILTTVGPQNPWVSPEQYAHTLSESVDLAGFPDSHRFFNPPQVVAQKVAEMTEAAKNKPQEPSPEMMRAQADAQKAQADVQLAQQKAEADLKLKTVEMEARIQIEREKAAAGIDLKRETAKAELELKRAEFVAELELEKMKVQLNPGGPGVGNIPTQ